MGIQPRLRGADLHDADLHHVDLHDADLRDTDLHDADLRGANLSSVNLTGANLRSTNLSRANLYDGNLSYTDLSGANLIDTNLNGANLRHADLNYADLSHANLGGADLNYADLGYANLSDTNLTRAYLTSIIAKNTQFERAICGHTLLTDVDLSGALALETIRHHGPSSIDIGTLYKSAGNLPTAFLESCGVPETMIAFTKSLVGKTIEYFSCFISHNTHDTAFCERLGQEMKQEKLRVWYAPEDLKGRDGIYRQIDKVIKPRDKLILVLSEASMNSRWVRVEIQRALLREQAEKRRVLFPISLMKNDVFKNWELVASDGMDLAGAIREYFIPDFSHWKNQDHFTKTFKKFLTDLRKNA